MRTVRCGRLPDGFSEKTPPQNPFGDERFLAAVMADLGEIGGLRLRREGSTSDEMLQPEGMMTRYSDEVRVRAGELLGSDPDLVLSGQTE